MYTYAKNDTIKMDKEFDFTNFLNKKFEMAETPEISETNTIKDEVFKKGLLKTIIMAGNGVFEVVDSRYGFSVKNQSDNYPGLGAAYESLADGCFVTVNPAPKIPRQAIESVIEWYKRITHKNGEEAQVNFYWNQFKKETISNEDGIEVALKDIPGVKIWGEELFSYTPKQYNSSGLTEVADEDEWYDTFNRNFGLYVETHSHNSMDAFASGTDEANSANDGFQLVFGHLNTEKPIMYSWMTMNRVMRLGMKKDELEKIMEINPDAVYNEQAEKVEYNINTLEFDESLFEIWDNQILTRPIPVYKKGNVKPLQQTYYGFDDLDFDMDKWWNQPKKTSTVVYSSQEEQAEVYMMMTEALESSIFHQTMLKENTKIDYAAIVELLKETFVSGYMASKNGPYTVTPYTQNRFEMSVQTEAEYVASMLDQLT